MREIWEKRKGQISMTVAIIGALGAVIASMFTSWGVAGSQISSIKENVAVVSTKENDHYVELKGSIEKMDKKLDILIQKK